MPSAGADRVGEFPIIPLKPLRASAVVAIAVAVAVSCSSLVGGEARAADNVSPTGPVVQNQFVVELRPVSAGAEVTAAAALAQAHGGAITQVYSHVFQGFAIHANAATADALRTDPAVASVEPDEVVRAASTVRADPAALRPPSPPAPVSSPPAPAVAPDAVRAYVVDSGIRFDHADLEGRAVAGFDAVGDGWNGDDCNGSGTMAAGLIAGARAGVAASTAVVSVRVLGCDGRGSLSQVLAGLDYVAAHAGDGSVVDIGVDGASSRLLDAAVTGVIRQGAIVVSAAGDDDRDGCDASPGRVAAVLDVGATDTTGTRASSSNYGSCLDLFALGSDESTDGVVTASATGSAHGSGVAAARVAAATAAALAADPSTSPERVQAAIVDRAQLGVVRDAGPGSPDRLLDSGSPVGPSDPDSSLPPTTTTGPSSTTTTAPSSTTTTLPGGVSGESIPAGVGVDAFARATDGALWWRQLGPGGWSAWQSFGGLITGTPAAVAGPNGTVYVFARGADGALWWQGYNGSSWSGWGSFGGVLSSDPVAYANSSGVWLFVRGGDMSLYWGRIDVGSGWTGWRGAGGVLASRPAVSADATGVWAAVVGSDGGVWAQRFDQDNGFGFVSLGGAATLDPVAAADSSIMTVYVRGTDGGLYRSSHSIFGWVPWSSLGGVLSSAPAVTTAGSNTSIFVRGSDNAAYWQPLPGGIPQGWRPLGGVLGSGPAAAADANGVSVFVRGSDGLLYVQRSEGSFPGWGGLPDVPIASDPVAISAPLINAAPAPPATGRGFDTCETPSLSTMASWRLNSPYTSVGIYVGGENRACANTALNTSGWVNTAVAQGWRLIPIYVGLQAPCINFQSTQFSRDPSVAYAQGGAAANDARARATAAGLPANAPIYFDLEGYNNADSVCVGAVRAFINGWISQLHFLGYRAAMYSSLCSGIVDEAAVYSAPGYNRLDAIWLAAWPYDPSDSRYATYVPNLFGFTGCGAGLADSMWTFHQRIRQYRGGHDETYAGLTISIDTNAVDGPLAP